MKYQFLFGILLVFAIANWRHFWRRIVSAAPKSDSTTSDDKHQAMEAIRQKYNLPALAAVVVKGGVIRDRIALGVRKWDDPTPVTTNDEFHIGSDTKSMTATLAGMLIDEGKLNWDTTIADVFPELRGRMNSKYENVTVQQLLTHRGGAPGAPPAAAWQWAWKRQDTPEEQRRVFIESVLREPPAAPPGTKMIYSNQGYAIVGAMLEKITGTPWETLMTDRLFKPLGMDSAGFGPPGTIGQVDQPWGHTRKSDTISPVQGDNPPAIAPAGAVHCTLDDLARYAIFQMHDQPPLLKPETLARLHTPVGGDYACGWICAKRSWAGGSALTHSGSNTMWYLTIWLAPKKDFAVIMATNIGGDDAGQACDDAVGVMISKWLK